MMAGKGKFIYIYEEDQTNVLLLKTVVFQAPEDAKYFSNLVSSALTTY